jgi:hypothetical protein
VGGHERVVDEVVLEEHAEDRDQQPRVGAGRTARWRSASRGLGAARIDHDERARRIAREVLERDPRPRDRVRVPRVLAEEQRDVAVLEVGARAGCPSCWWLTQNSPVFSCASALER